MSRKTLVLGLSVIGVCSFAVSQASAQILPGNFFPNPTLEAPGIGPDVGGSTLPRPDQWNLGGADFGSTSSPTIDFYDSTPPVTVTSPPSGSALSATHSLAIEDSSGSANGEWFSNLVTLPTALQSTPTSPGATFLLRYNLEYTNLGQDPSDRSPENFRVSIVWGTPGGNPTYGSFGGPDYNITISPILSPDVTQWLQFTQIVTAPIDPGNPSDPVTMMSIHMASGGGGGAEGNIWLDDVSAAVPEPASIVGMTSGMLLLLARRRRQA